MSEEERRHLKSFRYVQPQVTGKSYGEVSGGCVSSGRRGEEKETHSKKSHV